MGARLDAEPFTRFHAVLPAATPEAMEALARAWGGRAEGPAEPLAPELDATPWEQHCARAHGARGPGPGLLLEALRLLPRPPAILGHACSGDGSRPGCTGSPRAFLGGAMLHLTDSALSPALLDRVAAVVRRDRPLLRWHGFVRMEARLPTRPSWRRPRVEGGRAMLQWGLESASERLLRLMDKGVGRTQAPRRAARAASGAGIRSHVPAFGLPTETDLGARGALPSCRKRPPTCTT